MLPRTGFLLAALSITPGCADVGFDGVLPKAADGPAAADRSLPHHLAALPLDPSPAFDECVDAAAERAASAGRFETGGCARVVFDDAMTGPFALASVIVVLDGAAHAPPAPPPDGPADAAHRFEAFAGALPPGRHVVAVHAVYTGRGEGVFAYLKGYRFDVRSAHEFDVGPAGVVEVRAIAYERGGTTTPLEQRPAVGFSTQVRQDRRIP